MAVSNVFFLKIFTMAQNDFMTITEDTSTQQKKSFGNLCVQKKTFWIYIVFGSGFSTILS